MHSGQFATRLTCFAVLSAIEGDLRAILLDLSRSTGRTALFPSDVREKALQRATRADFAGLGTSSDSELLDFIDFADMAKGLNGFRGSCDVLDDAVIADISGQLEVLSSVRNRVCHSRPLEPDDFARLFDFATHLTKVATSSRWPTLTRTLDQLKHAPEFVLDLEIPSYWDEERSVALNNLPLPEFDDTGFLGRQLDRREIGRLLASGAHPVITIVGEGGNGKTALALRCAYDLLDLIPSPYEAVIWTSLKTKVLTSSGVLAIADAITDTFGMLRDLGRVLSPRAKDSDPQSLMDEIVEYMTEFPILLIIDNLETIDPATLRPLLVRVPPGSKVLLTSRIGLGELELRYPLAGFDETTTAIFLRKYASLLKLSLIAKATPETLADYGRKLFHNPLLLKWFVTAVSQGADPALLLSAKHPQVESAIRFCFENLYDKLTPTERRVLQVLASCPRPVSNTELTYLLDDYERHQIEWALNTLHRSSMLSRSGDPLGSAAVQYSLTAIANQFMTTCCPPDRELFSAVRRRLAEVALLSDGATAASQAYSYKVDAFELQNKDDRICAAILKLALNAHKKGDTAEAARLIEQAKRLRPQYADSYRVAGWIQQDAFRANQEFEIAISLAPRSPLVRYHYAQFLFNEMNDSQGALAQLDEALASNPPADAPLKTLKARALMYLGRFDEACSLFEAILQTCELVRRHRIATVDQCIDCYERHLHALSDAREFDKCDGVIEKGFALLKEFFGRKDYDEPSILRTAKFTRSAMACICRSGNSRTAERLMDFLKSIKELIEDSLILEGVGRFRATFPELEHRFSELEGFCRSGAETTTGTREGSRQLLMNAGMGDRITARVLRTAEHFSGLILQIEGTDVRAFLPKSQIELRAVDNLKQFVGQLIEAEVLSVDPDGASTKMVVSRRKLLEREREAYRKEFVAGVAIGDRYRGIVRRVVDFGVFVEISGVDVLMHVSSIPNGEVHRFAPGQEVDVEVIQVQLSSERVNVRPVKVNPR